MKNCGCELKRFVGVFEPWRSLPSRPVHEGLECWVALNSEQVDALFAEGAKPDEYSQRFEFRRTPVEALGRAAEFMAWRPRGQSEEPNPKSFVLCRVFVPASGYMLMTEQGRLETKKEGEWRLYLDARAVC